MLNKIPAHILEINKKFSGAGHKIYLVGGCVRDLLSGRAIKDWDFTTSATPEEILKIFPDGFYDNRFGTVGIPIKDQNGEGIYSVVEVTTFRTETAYMDRRHPAEVKWGKTVEEDLSRRDFTINAMAMEIEDVRHMTHDVRIIDPYGGREDIKNKIIRAVGDANLRFKEDALRLMRGIRFATQLAYHIDENTLRAIIEDAPLLAEISKERIRDEFIKILASDYPYEGVMLLKNTNLLQNIIPELLDGIGFSQERPGRHHKTDVFTHNILALKYCPSNDPIVRLATLIHDVAKPKVAGKDDEGYVIFHNHEIAGAKMARNITDNLRFSKKEQDKISTLIRWHMFTVDEHITDAAVRRFIRRIGVDNVRDIIDLRIGDRLGGGTQTAESWRLKLFKEKIEKQLTPAPFSVNDLAIDGHDIINELQIKPGKKIGELLQKLFEEVDEDLSKNTKEYLLKRIKKL